MQIEGFRHLSRSAADRADEARRTGRADDSPRRADDREGGDSIDTSLADFVGGAVRDAGRQLDTRIDSLLPRRDELLALADDPAAIRKAAQSFLAGVEEV